MAQVWPTDGLAAAFPEIDWVAVGCTTGSLPPGDGFDLPPGTCVPDPPIWEDSSGVSYSRGCGPPVLPPVATSPFGTRLRQFVGPVGWLGQTGHHLGRPAPVLAAGQPGHPGAGERHAGSHRLRPRRPDPQRGAGAAAAARPSSTGWPGSGASCLAGCRGQDANRDIAQPVRISICQFDALHVALALRG